MPPRPRLRPSFSTKNGIDTSAFVLIFGAQKSKTPKTTVVIADLDRSDSSRRLVDALKRESALDLVLTPKKSTTPFDAQSAEADPQKRHKLVHEIDARLLAENARPPIVWKRGTTCQQSYVKGYVSMVNSVYNGFRFEDVWLDRALSQKRPAADRSL